MAKLTVIIDPSLAPGFRLAGVETFAVRGPAEAQRVLLRLLAEGEAGVIAVDSAYLARLDDPVRRRIETSYPPVVIAIPSGVTAGTEARRSRFIAELIRRAIGIRMTFHEEEEGQR
jgi:vacuolar-type H+-ATPase subunit F/Vma7